MIEQLGSGKTKYINIRNPIPIYITYITAWVDQDGFTHFREDIYQRDSGTENQGSTHQTSEKDSNR